MQSVMHDTCAHGAQETMMQFVKCVTRNGTVMNAITRTTHPMNFTLGRCCLAHHVNIAANIGAGKSVSTNFVKTEFYAALGGLDISESMVVNPRGSIQGITAALVKAMRTTGSALL